jgi:thioredoxin reductase (NADPH)
MTEDGEIIVYGTTWCPDCKRAKQFFAEQRITYTWVDIEHDLRAMEYVEQINQGKRIIPTIVFPDGSLLIEPSNAELAAKLEITSKAQREFYDVIIIGGGPTGLTTALYLAREGVDVLVIERAGLGGQAGITERLDNFPGFDEGIAGGEFARRLTNQARRFGAELLAASDVQSIAKDGPYFSITVSDGARYGARAVLLASGSRYRKLDVPGEDGLIGINVHYCATCDGAFYKGKEVLVIGGGNSGFEEGLFLTKFATKVSIVALSEVRASKILQDKVAERSDMAVFTNHAVRELKGDGRLTGVVVEDLATGELKEWTPAGIFVFIGLSPNSDLVRHQIETDRFGFVVAGPTLQTSLAGLFAAGDVRAGSTKQAASAAGEGATAALMIREYLKTA